MKLPVILLLYFVASPCFATTLECYMIDIRGGTPTLSTLEKYIYQQGHLILPPTEIPDDGVLRLPPNSEDSIPVDFQATLKSIDDVYSLDIDVETTQRGPSTLEHNDHTEILIPTSQVSHLTDREVILHPDQWTLIGGLKRDSDTRRFYALRVSTKN